MYNAFFTNVSQTKNREKILTVQISNIFKIAHIQKRIFDKKLTGKQPALQKCDLEK